MFRTDLSARLGTWCLALFCTLSAAASTPAGGEAPPLRRLPAAADVAPLEKLVVQSDGRRKPFLTFATEKVRAIYGRASYKLPSGEKIPPTVLALDLVLAPEPWRSRPLVLCDDAALRHAIGLPADQRHFSLESLRANTALPQLLAQAEELRRAGGSAKPGPVHQSAKQLATRMLALENLLGGASFRPVPAPDAADAAWGVAGSAAERFPKTGGQFAAAWEKFSLLFSSGEARLVNDSARSVAEAAALLKPEFSLGAAALATEIFYEKTHPFRIAWVLLLASALVLALSLPSPNPRWYRAGWWLAGGGFAALVAGIAARSVIAGRPPVTNMYESVIWLAFGSVFFAMVFEARYRCRYYLLGALPIAVLALVLADSQPVVLDASIHPLVPVLRHNFWLTVHVLTITLSYAAFALALGVGHIFLGQIAFLNRRPDPALGNYLYKVLQIGVLLLAAGTILGGVWANYSWGRFWDWDPKETWALVALLSYLFLLHGRLIGWWGATGLAAGSILAFQTVLFAWYGVNFILASGLHSYGFGAGGTGYIGAYLGAETAFVTAVFLRLRRQRAIGAGA